MTTIKMAETHGWTEFLKEIIRLVESSERQFGVTLLRDLNFVFQYSRLQEAHNSQISNISVLAIQRSLHTKCLVMFGCSTFQKQASIS